MKRVDYSGGKENVAKEAREKKRGGALAFDGESMKKKPKKASGGACSDKSPFSSAGGGKASTSPFSSAYRR